MSEESIEFSRYVDKHQVWRKDIVLNYMFKRSGYGYDSNVF